MKSNLYYYQFILAVLLIAYSSGSLQAQNILDSRISIKEPSTTVRKLLKNIERKLPVNFGYSNESIPGNPAVHLETGSLTLREIIQSICNQLHLTYDLVGNFVVFNIKENVEEKISGVVSNEKGEPLAGATIAAGRDETMTATDENGAFSLTVKRGVRELRVTSVGYHPLTVRLKGEQHLTLSLTVNETGMDDVLVVGYGTQKKSNIAGAVSVVRPSDIGNHQIARAENALQGRVAGVAAMAISGAPGSNSNIRIRGNTSFNAAANDPLYVIDGVVVGSNNIEMITPGEIASIEILKDAASASIYGARSSAGVVLITTKKGAEGNYIVNYNTYLGFQKPAQKLRLLNATEYATLRNEQSVNGGGGIIFEKPEHLGKGTDWQELLFNNRAFIQNHNINISGGRNGSSFFGSVGYMSEDGVVATDISNFKRYNIRINSKHKITEKVTFGESIGYAHVKTLVGVAANTNFLSPLTSAVNLDPITPALVTDPDMINEPPYSNQPVVKNEQGLFYGVSDIVTQQMANPLAYIKTRLGNYNWSDNIVGNAFIELDTKTGIKARSVAGVDLRYWGTEAFLPVFYLNPTMENAQTSFTRARNKQANWNVENTLSFEKKHKDHHIIALLGQGAYMDNNSSGLTVTYYGIPAATFKEATMNFSVAAANKNSSGFEGVRHTVSSLFSRVQYSYLEKYLFTGVLRRDGSSRFGANNRFGYFPSVAAGWIISREKFFREKNVGFLKIRLSYGKNGSDVLGDFRYVSTIGDGKNYTFGSNEYYLIGHSDNAPSNPDLRWEETQQLNVGFDARWRNGFSLSFDWFNKTTSGILMPIVFPRYVGITGIGFGNIGDMANRGVEVEMGYEKKIGPFALNIRANGSYIKNRVTHLGQGLDFTEDGALQFQSSTYALTRIAVGQPLNSFFGFKTNGIFQDQSQIDNYVGAKGKIQPNAVPGDFRWIDLNNDGQIDANDRTFLGAPTPSWAFGFSLNMSWKAIDFVLFAQGVAGNKVFQGLRRLDISTANWQEAALGRWHGAGTSDTHPRLTTNDINRNYSHPSDFYLQDAGYLRFKTVQIGYTIPGKFIKTLGLGKARFFLSTNNFITFTKYTGFDPEIGGSSTGVDRGVYPQPKSLLLGLNLTL